MTLSRVIAELHLAQRDLPWFLRVYVFVPATLVLVVLLGSVAPLPPGPLCDDGMILFMEGGCDWGLSNIFFHSKLGLLLAVNLAFAACLWRRPVSFRGFVPHLVILLIQTWVMRSGEYCDTYYSHPNGSLGQMTLEVAAFAVLGLSILVSWAPLTGILGVVAAFLWNGAYWVAFYALLPVASHWTWAHTLGVCSVLLGVAGIVAFPQLGESRVRRSITLPELAMVLVAIPTAALFAALPTAWVVMGPLLVGVTLLLWWGTKWTALRIGSTPSRAKAAAWLLTISGWVALVAPTGLDYNKSRRRSLQLGRAALEDLIPDLVGRLRAEGLYQRARVGSGQKLGLSDLRPTVQLDADRLLGRDTFEGGLSIVVLVSLDDAEYLMLWRNSSFTYIDVRRLMGEHSLIIGYDQFRLALDSGKPQETSLWSFLTQRSEYAACWPVKDGQGRAVALVRVEMSRFQ